MTRSDDPEIDVRAMQAALGHAEADLPPIAPSRVGELLDAQAYWSERLAPLLDLVAPVRPSGALWRRIAADTQDVHSPARHSVRSRPLGARLWAFLGLGPLAAYAAGVACVIVAALASVPQPALIAILQSPDGARPGFAIEIAADRTLRIVPLGQTVVPPDRALEFWTKADSDAGPTSLGLLLPDVPAALLFPDPVPRPGQLFEVTLEPATGSPIGRPTGPILFIGRAIPGGTI